MKHLLTAIACFFALSMSAQEALPWNPNANNDNIIGTVDLLAMLNVYGEEYTVQTCFKGNICSFWNNNNYPTNQVHNSPAGCGTIIGKTWNSSPPYFTLAMTIHLTNEGYSEGDVIHLIHDFQGSGNGENMTFKTLIEGNWETVTSIWPTAYWLAASGKVIFNGEYWEELD